MGASESASGQASGRDRVEIPRYLLSRERHVAGRTRRQAQDARELAAAAIAVVTGGLIMLLAGGSAAGVLTWIEALAWLGAAVAAASTQS